MPLWRGGGSRITFEGKLSILFHKCSLRFWGRQGAAPKIMGPHKTPTPVALHSRVLLDLWRGQTQIEKKGKDATRQLSSKWDVMNNWRPRGAKTRVLSKASLRFKHSGIQHTERSVQHPAGVFDTTISQRFGKTKPTAGFFRPVIRFRGVKRCNRVCRTLNFENYNVLEHYKYLNLFLK